MIRTPNGWHYQCYEDFLQVPHLLISGTTGSGKSTIINGLIYSILTKLPYDNKDRSGAGTRRVMFLIDPKRVELARYKGLQHAERYGVTHDEYMTVLEDAVATMESRYRYMEQAGLRMYTGADIYVIIDEFADLMSEDKKHVVPLVRKLSAEGRAARIHMIIATQTPMASVLPSVIRNNFPWRICLCTDNETQSRLILGEPWCADLPWYGEMYYKSPGPHNIQHYTGIPMYTDEQLDQIVEHWRNQPRCAA